MLIVFLSILLFLSVCFNIFSGYFNYKFIKIIMIFEDDIVDLTSSLEDVEDSMTKVTEVAMFYEDNSIKNKVAEVMDFVKIAKFQLNYMCKRFTDRSKQRYVTYVPTEGELEQYLASQGTRDSDFKEGTIVHVGRPR